MSKLIRIILPVLIVSLAVGFMILSRSQGSADNNNQAQTEEGTDSGDATGLVTKSGIAVPNDICYSDKVESVVFSHKKHVIEIGFDCSTCHTGIFEMKAKNVENLPDFDMKGLDSGKYCGSCHSSTNNVAFSTEADCARCHIGVQGTEEREQSTTESTTESTAEDTTDNTS
jgi:c(7)-type cytochrome triheme protein